MIIGRTKSVCPLCLRVLDAQKRAERDGGYRSLPLRLRNVPDPAFWRGLAGVAYAMLVYADALEAPVP